jgi:hypothetical protein
MIFFDDRASEWSSGQNVERVARQKAQEGAVQIIDDSGLRASHFIDIGFIYRYSLPAMQFCIGGILSDFNRNRGNNGNTENNDCR